MTMILEMSSQMGLQQVKKPSFRPRSKPSLVAPAILFLVITTTVPTLMTLWFSLQRYNLINVANKGFVGLENYAYFLSSAALATSIFHSVLIVLGVLIITVSLGIAFALILNMDFFGRQVARVIAISPFFIMPTVAALIWKNLLMHPVNGLFTYFSRSVGIAPIDWFGNYPLFSIIVIIAWQWFGFSLLILLTALQSLDEEIKDAAMIDGAGPIARFIYILIPHLRRPIAIIVMIETIFLLSVFAEIFVTTSGGPGLASTNLAFLIYVQALLRFDVGLASAGGVISIVLANIVAFFLARTVAKTLAS